jgi:eukaryotic-like serine/threonine-protein kinase
MSATDLFDQLIDQYKLEKHIGRRDFTDVYLAYDVDHNQSVELEILLPEYAGNAHFAQQFTQRARALGQLRHPNIAHVLQVGATPDARPYIATERVDGYPLTERLAQLAQQPAATHSIYALKLVQQITAALLLTERLDIYHNQLTPDHILLKKVKLKAEDAVVVINLGIPAQEKLSPNGRFSPTDQPYISPEQQEGRPIDSRSHVYSLGVILYTMLTGEPPQGPDPFWARLLGAARSNKAALEKARPDLAAETVALAARCLRKEPRRRFQSLAELVAALDAAIAAEELRIHTSAVSQPARPPMGNLFTTAGAAALSRRRIFRAA